MPNRRSVESECRVEGIALGELGLDRPASAAEAGFLFCSLIRHESTRALPEPMVTNFGDTCHDYAREGHDFQSGRKGVLRHAALAAEGQLSSLNPGYAEQ